VRCTGTSDRDCPGATSAALVENHFGRNALEVVVETAEHVDVVDASDRGPPALGTDQVRVDAPSPHQKRLGVLAAKAGVTFGVAGDLAAQQVRYAEVTVTPDSHLLLRIEPDGLAAARDSARKRASDVLGIELAWIFDIPGELGITSGLRTIDWVERFAPAGSVGFGLGGPDEGVTRAQFAEVFARARARGLASVPHAGETTGPETIWESVRELGAVRIEHGISAARDPELMAYLVDHGIALDVCPTSNVCTRAIANLASHPLPDLVRAGVTVTVNSDDPGMFSTSTASTCWCTSRWACRWMTSASWRGTPCACPSAPPMCVSGCWLR
jgi:adenosine deaminase